MTFGPYKATLVRIIDGDTIVVDVLLKKTRTHAGADVDLGFNIHQRTGGIWLVDQHVRFEGCNADEHTTPGGQAAIAWLATMIKPGDSLTLMSHGVDKFGGRIDGSITLADGRDLVTLEIAAGHAAPWNGQGLKPTT